MYRTLIFCLISFFYLHFFVRSDEWKIETNINIHLFGTRPIALEIKWEYNFACTLSFEIYFMWITWSFISVGKILKSNDSKLLNIFWKILYLIKYKHVLLGVVHKLRWQYFSFFDRLPPLCWHFLQYERWQKLDIFGLPTYLVF